MGSIPNTTKRSYFFFAPDDGRLKLITDKSHRLYDRRCELPIDESMVESIANPSIGMINPIQVRKVGDFYEVVDGRQRVRAAREAALRYPDRKILIKAIPATLRDAEAARNATIANVQRTDDSPTIRGENAQRMLEMGFTEEELESYYGAKIGTIKEWISFSETAPASVCDCLDRGEITWTQARKISKMHPERQREALEKALSTERPRPGPKKGEPRRRKIRITAIERDDGGYDINHTKCTVAEFGTVIEAMDRIYNDPEAWK